MKYELGQKVYTLDNGKLVAVYILARELQEFRGEEYGKRHNYKRYRVGRRDTIFDVAYNHAEVRHEHEVYGSIEEAQKAIFGGLE